MQTSNLTNTLQDMSFFRLREGHIIKPFDCEDDDLNEFLFQEAIPYRKEMLATTFIIENKERTLGYYSLLNQGTLVGWYRLYQYLTKIQSPFFGKKE